MQRLTPYNKPRPKLTRRPWHNFICLLKAGCAINNFSAALLKCNSPATAMKYFKSLNFIDTLMLSFNDKNSICFY